MALMSFISTDPKDQRSLDNDSHGTRRPETRNREQAPAHRGFPYSLLNARLKGARTAGTQPGSLAAIVRSGWLDQGHRYGFGRTNQRTSPARQAIGGTGQPGFKRTTSQAPDRTDANTVAATRATTRIEPGKSPRTLGPPANPRHFSPRLFHPGKRSKLS